MTDGVEMRDPDGYRIEIVERSGEAAAKPRGRSENHTRARDSGYARHRAAYAAVPQRSEGARMSAEENVQTAKDGYAAFGRGDLPGILELLTDDIEWVNPGPPDVIPGAGTHRGKDAVAGFFGTLAQSTDFQAFERGSSSPRETMSWR